MILGTKLNVAALVGAAALTIGTAAHAAVSVVQQAAPAPTYGIVLNFDEPGGPTGNNVPNNSWAGAPWLIPDFSSGDVVANDVGDHSSLTGQGTNSYLGPFGVFMTFSQDMTEMSFQGWDDSGPATPFGGGAAVGVFKDGVEVGNWFGTPAFGGVGNTWYHITTTDGSTFNQVNFLGFGFFPQTIVDNLSWNNVPEPSSLAVLGLAAVGMLRRRK